MVIIVLLNAHQRSDGKVIFSVVSVILFRGEGIPVQGPGPSPLCTGRSPSPPHPLYSALPPPHQECLTEMSSSCYLL